MTGIQASGNGCSKVMPPHAVSPIRWQGPALGPSSHNINALAAAGADVANVYNCGWWPLHAHGMPAWPQCRGGSGSDDGSSQRIKQSSKPWMAGGFCSTSALLQRYWHGARAVGMLATCSRRRWRGLAQLLAGLLSTRIAWCSCMQENEQSCMQQGSAWLRLPSLVAHSCLLQPE